MVAGAEKLSARRVIVASGPPGTGKSTLADPVEQNLARVRSHLGLGKDAEQPREEP